MRSSLKVAFCGIIAAVSIVMMFLTGVIPVATIAIPAIAGCLLIPVVVETNVRWGFATYAAVAALAFITAPDREAALVYIFLFGYYPVLFAVIGRIKKIALRYVIKLLVFNAALSLELWLSVTFLNIPLNEIGGLGQYSIIITYVLFNIICLVYDYSLNGLILLYLNKFHDRMRNMFRK